MELHILLDLGLKLSGKSSKFEPGRAVDGSQCSESGSCIAA